MAGHRLNREHLIDNETSLLYSRECEAWISLSRRL